MRTITFAENLKQNREKLKMSQADLARKLGISYQTYNGYETKGNEPKYELLIQIASVLGVSIDDLLGYAPDKYTESLILSKKAGLSISEKDEFMHDGNLYNFINIENISINCKDFIHMVSTSKEKANDISHHLWVYLFQQELLEALIRYCYNVINDISIQQETTPTQEWPNLNAVISEYYKNINHLQELKDKLKKIK